MQAVTQVVHSWMNTSSIAAASFAYSSCEVICRYVCFQVQDLLEWLLQRGQELNATAQLGPQGLGATAGALSRLQQAQRQQQQQAAQQQALRQQQQEAEAAARKLRQQQAAAVERDQLMRELVDAAVSQKHRLSPQVCMQCVLLAAA